MGNATHNPKIEYKTDNLNLDNFLDFDNVFL